MRSKPLEKHVQLTLDHARRPTGRGGWRPNAGRPRGRTKVAHARRERVGPSYPQHVTLRIVPGVPSLRQQTLVQIIRDSIAQAHGDEYRVTQFAIESNHIHFIIEASSNGARASGLQALMVRVARRLNRVLGRSGKLFAERYHSRALKTPSEVRYALRYVLNNTRHHVDADIACLERSWFDPYSSAPWFDGWAEPIRPDAKWKRDLLEMPSPTAKARSWLLNVGWRRRGLIRLDEAPGPKQQR